MHGLHGLRLVSSIPLMMSRKNRLGETQAARAPPLPLRTILMGRTKQARPPPATTAQAAASRLKCVPAATSSSCCAASATSAAPQRLSQASTSESSLHLLLSCPYT
jgi:hypothetical protein